MASIANAISFSHNALPAHLQAKVYLKPRSTSQYKISSSLLLMLSFTKELYDYPCEAETCEESQSWIRESLLGLSSFINKIFVEESILRRDLDFEAPKGIVSVCFEEKRRTWIAWRQYCSADSKQNYFEHPLRSWPLCRQALHPKACTCPPLLDDAPMCDNSSDRPLGSAPQIQAPVQELHISGLATLSWAFSFSYSRRGDYK